MKCRKLLQRASLIAVLLVVSGFFGVISASACVGNKQDVEARSLWYNSGPIVYKQARGCADLNQNNAHVPALARGWLWSSSKGWFGVAYSFYLEHSTTYVVAVSDVLTTTPMLVQHLESSWTHVDLHY
jgi:hypothetical protein